MQFREIIKSSYRVTGIFNNMKKTAVVYDKWLDSLGGGEVVACTMAKILRKMKYDVTFISGKKVPLSLIQNQLNINLSGVKFKEVWNDDISMKKLVAGKDLFINTSFIDYSYPHARKNIYYTHFPTKPYSSIKSKVLNRIIFPFLLKFVKPIELVNEPKGKTLVNGRLAYQIVEPIKMAFFYLEPKKMYQLKFSIFLESFSKTTLTHFRWNIEKAHILKKVVKIDHHHNVIHFSVLVEPLLPTIYLRLRMSNNFVDVNRTERIYVLNPKVLPNIPFTKHLYKRFYERLLNKLRAGLYVDARKRLNSYQTFVTNSQFVKKWIRTYWKKDAIVLYPPIQLLFDKYNLVKFRKKNWICSIGRFFTLGHGKKQGVLIDAFIQMYKSGYKNWQLHLAGGLGYETSSQRFAKYLKKKAEGYPIFFHFNTDRNTIEKILLSSKIYWHATGYNENENSHPVRFEHFGIAPVEAMSAGCIPLLFNGGGLKEIITILRLNPKLYLFQTKNELVQKTIYQIGKNRNVIQWDTLFKRLKTEFSSATFSRKFQEIIEKA